ncbi:hypothetical protein [Streptomyces sp. NPDC093676]|uniref:hypothetical protein n=1 Tax=Streptomyces sp. NPDC093676 TaxID=3366050 RepID=UPI0037F43877
MPPPGAVKYYFHLWRDEGSDQDIHDLLRWQLREKRFAVRPSSLPSRARGRVHGVDQACRWLSSPLLWRAYWP